MISAARQIRAPSRPALLAPWLFFALLLAFPTRLIAADTTPPTTPVVTDDGAYTSTTTTLHAVWTSSDPDSGISEYQYLIRRDSSTGLIVVNWTSVGTATHVTRTGLTLANGKTYVIGVKAKNGDGLWSAEGDTDGLKVDTTAPSVPGTPTEGSPDTDFDSDGSYTVSWAAASDQQSTVAAYELQERLGATGAWTTLSSTLTTTSFSVSGRLHNTQYFYQVRAKNGAGLLSAYSAASDGVLVDTTAPTAVTVTDDGATTSSTTTLHAIWTASSDSQSGIVDYQYLIRQDATTGTLVVNWTSVGLATSVTKTGLSLVNGKTYFIGVRAKNGAGKFSTVRYSDGILVQADLTPPTGSLFINDEAAFATTETVMLTLSAMDDSGSVAQMQCSNDALTYSAPESFATTKAWTLAGGEGPKTVYVKFSDPSHNWSGPVSDSITLDTTSPSGKMTSPSDGAVLGAQ